MKRPYWLLLVLVLMVAVSVQAQRATPLGWNYYTSVGVSPNNAFSLRFGVMNSKLGAEVYAKSDINRLNQDIGKLDGKPYRLSLMGGVSYQPIYNIIFTVNAGYGAKGVYRVDATQTTYGAEDLMTGLELGMGIHMNVGSYFLLYCGYSVLPVETGNIQHKEFTVGVGLYF